MSAPTKTTPRRFRLQVPIPNDAEAIRDLVMLLQESGEVSLSVDWEVTPEFSEFDIADTVQEINAQADLHLGHPYEVRQ